MPAKVADASVIVAFAFGEPNAAAALALVDGAELTEPDLLRYELASVARKKIIQRPELEDQLIAALAKALGMDYHWFTADAATLPCLAGETGLSVYDASYVQAAEAVRAELVTFDARLKTAYETRSRP